MSRASGSDGGPVLGFVQRNAPVAVAVVRNHDLVHFGGCEVHANLPCARFQFAPVEVTVTVFVKAVEFFQETKPLKLARLRAIRRRSASDNRRNHCQTGKGNEMG
ncbi:MAG: hypothetical protein MUF04_05165 [Akkermansiaceae bacterium]|nr:hypothetical protein [Akkermansiaceae bacterium]